MKSNRFVLFLGRQLAGLRAGAARFSPVYAAAGVCYFSLCGLILDFGRSWNQLFTAVSEACVWAMLAGLCARLFCEKAPQHPVKRLPWAAALGAGLISGVALILYELDTAWVALVYFGGVLAGICAAVWLLYRPENESTLFAHLVKSAVFCGAVALLVTGGLAVCLLACDALLFSVDGDFLLCLLIMPWVLLLPSLFCAQLPACDQAPALPKAYTVLVEYVVLPLYLLLIGILYGYIGKIIFRWAMPAGRMNWYASLALAGYLFFWLGLRHSESRWVRSVLRWGWAGMLPIVTVQLVGIVIRLRAYGLTAARYAGLLCLAVGLAGLILAAKNAAPRLLFAAFAAAVLLGSCTPLNILDLPRFTHAKRTEAVLARYNLWDGTAMHRLEGEIPEADAQTIRDSWRYLRHTSDKAMWESPLTALLSNMDSSQFENTLGFSSEQPDSYRNTYRSLSLYGSDVIPVEGYSRAYPFTRYAYRGDESIGLWFTQSWDDGTTMQWDTTDYLAHLVDTYPTDTHHETLRYEDRFVKLNATQTLYIQTVYIGMENDLYQSVDITGYLLVAPLAESEATP